jgi:RimJ/RimL family protein N-acetyltransferase
MDVHLAERRISKHPLTRLPDGRAPERVTLTGRTVQLLPIDPALHTASLYQATHSDDAGTRVWDYLAYGPFADLAAMQAWAEKCASSTDPIFLTVFDLDSQRAGGIISLMSIEPAHGSIEIGHIWFAPFLQNTRQSSEALFLAMHYCLETLQYRRLEWKCDAMNQASRQAAARLGFGYEGTFFQHRVVKGRNRDTAWFSILDSEWPRIRANFEAWLDDANFDANGRARTSLGAANRALRMHREVPDGW